ncbi:9326_t:CDS:2 [Paraglomus brasilianum]|uniref:Cyclin-dependent kinases regulatory subunit n=1 Tax=Paraglomus brasilianum TaxID=144538 RepID=A0A9N9GCQ0_9GLOM|nr:9326_t:CDS:2 [Paraglomus brasilianum]
MSLLFTGSALQLFLHIISPEDNENEYRHVILPRAIAEFLPRNKLLTEEEWRSYGLKQSTGWEHYMIHSPEPHILLFRREKDYQIKYPTEKGNQV